MINETIQRYCWAAYAVCIQRGGWCGAGVAVIEGTGLGVGTNVVGGVGVLGEGEGAGVGVDAGVGDDVADGFGNGVDFKRGLELLFGKGFSLTVSNDTILSFGTIITRRWYSCSS
jgi:hypothetical protein